MSRCFIRDLSTLVLYLGKAAHFKQPGDWSEHRSAPSPNTVQLAMVMKWAFSLRAKPALDCGGSTPP